MIYVITYKRPGLLRNDTDLIREIKNLGPGWAQAMDSTWIVATELSAQQIVDRLLPYMDGEDDGFLVNELSTQYDGWLPMDIWDWIENTARQGWL